jgi:hypothetical protein
MATAAFCSFLSSWSGGDTAAGVAALRAVADDDHFALLFEAIIDHVLAAGGSGGGVYVDSADAFELFVSTGGNVGMYEALDVAISEAWRSSSGSSGGGAWSLLDVGTGGGLGLIPALKRTAGSPDGQLPATLELVEPSEPMLATALQQIEPLLASAAAAAAAAAAAGASTPAAADAAAQRGAAADAGRSTELRVHNLSLQDLIARADTAQPDSSSRWDVCQATFSLQSLPPAERRAGLAWLAQRCSVRVYSLALLTLHLLLYTQRSASRAD